MQLGSRTASSYAQPQPVASSSSSSLFTVDSPRRITHATYRSSLLVTADEAGQVSLARLESSSKGKGRASLQLRSGAEVLSLAICGDEVIVATRKGQTGLIEVFGTDDCRLRSTLPSLHRTPPHTLAVSPSSVVASISNSELLLFDASTDWSCKWALRGPSPSSPSPSSSLSTALWLLTPGGDEPNLLTVWKSGELCLWTRATVSKSMNDSMQLKWRVVPPSVSAGTVNPAVAASADGLLLFVASASDQKGSTDILVWDVEERSLFKQVSVPLDSVDSLHVLESDEEGSSLLLRSHSTLHHLTIPLYNDEHSIHLVREGVQQVVSVEGGRIFLLMKDGKLEMLPLGSLLRVEPVAEKSTVWRGSQHQQSNSPPRSDSPSDQFNPLWLEPCFDPHRQQRHSEHLRLYLERTGSFPSEQRLAAYAILLRCPSSPAYFTLLSTPEDKRMMNAFRSEWELADLGVQARMESIIHLLRARGFPAAALVDRIAPLIYSLVSSARQTSDQQLFEVIVTLLLRWTRVLWDERAEGRRHLWQLAEEALDRDIAEELREKGVVLSKVFSSISLPLLGGGGSGGSLLDHIIARPPLFFVSLLVAVVQNHARRVASLSAEDAVASFRGLQPSSALISEASRIEQLIRGSNMAERLSGIPGYEEAAYLDASYHLVCSYHLISSSERLGEEVRREMAKN